MAGSRAMRMRLLSKAPWCPHPSLSAPLALRACSGMLAEHELGAAGPPAAVPHGMRGGGKPGNPRPTHLARLFVAHDGGNVGVDLGQRAVILQELGLGLCETSAANL